MINIFHRIFNSIKYRWHFYRHGYTQEDFIRDLRNKGVVIGERTFINQNNTCIDVTRPSLVTIGSDCYLNSGFTLMTHDFVSGVMRNVYGEFINSSGRVTIGNNVHHFASGIPSYPISVTAYTLSWVLPILSKIASDLSSLDRKILRLNW